MPQTHSICPPNSLQSTLLTRANGKYGLNAQTNAEQIAATETTKAPVKEPQKEVVVENLHRQDAHLKAFRVFWEGLRPDGASEGDFRTSTMPSAINRLRPEYVPAPWPARNLRQLPPHQI